MYSDWILHCTIIIGVTKSAESSELYSTFHFIIPILLPRFRRHTHVSVIVGGGLVYVRAVSRGVMLSSAQFCSVLLSSARSAQFCSVLLSFGGAYLHQKMAAGDFV